jgi:hypothetical protein
VICTLLPHCTFLLCSLQAVLQLNLCRVLQDPTGEQMRPLVVRRANMRKPASALMQQQPLPHHTQHATSHGGGSFLSGGGAAGAMHSGSSSQTTGPFQQHASMSMSMSGGGVAAANAAVNAAMNAAAALPSQSLSGVVEFVGQMGGGGGMDVPLQLQPMGLQVGEVSDSAYVVRRFAACLFV